MEIKTNKTEILLAELEQLRQKIASLEAQKDFRQTSPAFSQEIFENNPMSLQIVDKLGYTLQVNAAHTKLFGAVPPADYTVFDDPLVKKQGLAGLFDIAKSGKTVHFPDFQYNIHELIPEFPDVPVWIKMVVFPLPGNEGQPERFVLMHEDLTARKQTEELIRKSEERFKRLIENSPDIVYSFSTTRGGSYHSSRVIDVLGYTPEQLNEQPMLWQDSVHPDDLEMVIKSVAATADGHPINTEYRLKSASGEWRWIHDRSIHLHKNNNGEIIIEGLVTDITDRKLAEEKLIRSELGNKNMQELFRNMADIMPDMLWAKDLNKNFIFVNNSICQNLLNAKDTTEPIGKNDMFFASRERQSQPENPHWHTFGEICRDSDSIVLQTGETGHFDEFGNVKGKFLFLDVIKTPLRNDKGEIIGVVGAARDVTRSKEAEKKLHESEANLKAIIENSTESIWSVNANYEIQYINAVFAGAFQNTFGIKIEPGMNITDV